VKQVVIENPIINSPYEEPKRHFRFTKDGITNEIADGRRISEYIVPVPQPRKQGNQMSFDTEWVEDRFEENKFINQVRDRVAKWRAGGYLHVTKTTRWLLDYWTRPDRDHKLYFCQIEALETVIFITEAAKKTGDAWIENRIAESNEDANPGLFRIAMKMATGSGKTVVMTMLIAWHVLNKQANPQDARFTDSFLVVTPGITIRDRLRVLWPNDPNNYYKAHDIVPPESLEQVGKAKIIITNFHAFLKRERTDASKNTKKMLPAPENGESAFKESPDQMVRRVCRDFGNKKNIVVINDEAHHCYRHRVEPEEIRLPKEERKEADKRNEAARVWISGLEAVKAKMGIKAIYDLSATPFFLRGSGYPEGKLFPWVVSDFSLIDAIESGVVKIPRVPVSDDSMMGAQPTYRDLWGRIRKELPHKGRGTEAYTGEPSLPIELEGALQSLYGNYEKSYAAWQENTEARAQGLTPPVFIVVCNNTNVSKMVYDYVAGYPKPGPDGSEVLVPGKLPLFSNVADGTWIPRPNSILIDSEQLESGDAMSKDFKKMAEHQIEEFKDEYRARFPGRDVENLTDEELLREVMNTVGKPGKLGEQIRCVVSVSMLTEGWDATTVTHILGVRAFGTQLLCEQVIGRGLRRMSHVPDDKGLFLPEYAEVYGVPFSFIPCAGTDVGVVLRTPTRVRALEERIACEITFPRLMGYRYDMPGERLTAKFTKDSQLVLTTAHVPTKTENAPIVGETVIHTLDDLKAKREQEVAFLLAKLTLEKYFRDDEKNLKFWLFPQVLDISRDWLSKCVTLKDNSFPQLLLLVQNAHDAADRIYRSIVESTCGEKVLKPILYPYDTVGSTRYVDFDTTRPVYETDPQKCHVNYVVADTESWEQKLAQTVEDMDEVVSYVKNQRLNFIIPYSLSGDDKKYIPDFIVRIDDGHGPGDLLNLILECSGEPRRDKAAKVATARTLWVVAVNNHGGFGRWAFLEVTDPWDAQNTIRAAVANESLFSTEGA
jgi:type III restriction enzyme